MVGNINKSNQMDLNCLVFIRLVLETRLIFVRHNIHSKKDKGMVGNVYYSTRTI